MEKLEKVTKALLVFDLFALVLTAMIVPSVGAVTALAAEVVLLFVLIFAGVQLGI